MASACWIRNGVRDLDVLDVEWPDADALARTHKIDRHDSAPPRRLCEQMRGELRGGDRNATSPEVEEGT
jgi:hypothetical protein